MDGDLNHAYNAVKMLAPIHPSQSLQLTFNCELTSYPDGGEVRKVCDKTVLFVTHPT